MKRFVFFFNFSFILFFIFASSSPSSSPSFSPSNFSSSFFSSLLRLLLHLLLHPPLLVLLVRKFGLWISPFIITAIDMIQLSQIQGVKNGPAMLHGASGATRKG